MANKESNADIPIGEVLAEPEEEDYEEAKLLGQLLIKDDLITAEQLDSALLKQREDWQENQESFLGQILVEMGAIKQDALICALVKQTHLPFLNLLNYEIDPEVLDMIPQEICQKYALLPIDTLGKILTVAMCNPSDKAALEIVSQLWPDLHIKRVTCAWPHFQATFKRHFDKAELGEVSFIGLRERH